jgi:hypothetical protein
MYVDLADAFDKYQDEYQEFARIEEPLHRRRDICAMMLLDQLAPGETGSGIISGAEDEAVMLDIDCTKLADVITEEDVITLLRCGVGYDEEYGCLVYVP